MGLSIILLGRSSVVNVRIFAADGELVGRDNVGYVSRY
jgi:hypothetical protein